MKIAIQGHPTRGKEVIQILESLGGRNAFNYNGDYIRTAYFIGMDYSIYGFCTDSPKVGFKVYTLEEFEKEFPLKIGDKVISTTINFIGTITKLREGGWYYVKCASGDLVYVFRQNLKLYKEMKEERNITLTLDKAQEWYKKGGELKEIALQAFTEKELNPLPRSWEEFCENYPVREGECYLKPDGEIRVIECDVDTRIAKNWIPSKKSAEAYLAMMQLEQLRNCWRQGWGPNWLNGNEKKYAIKGWRDKSSIEVTYVTHAFLSFPTYEMAKEFLECFRDLIETAKDLI